MALSPLMKQYMEIKQEHPECILMCRIGDFYEMFFEDAKTASKELDLVLTGKDCGLEERAPMCGVPYHAVDTYIAKLVSLGEKVAICEQLSDPKAAGGGLVERDDDPGVLVWRGVSHRGRRRRSGLRPGARDHGTGRARRRSRLPRVLRRCPSQGRRP